MMERSRGCVLSAFALLVIGLCSSWPQPCVAQTAVQQRPLKDAINVVAGASCLDGARLADHVVTWLGRAHVDADVRVVVSGDPQDPRRISFVLVQDARSRSRVFESSPEICGDMHAVVGLAIALAIDADVLSSLAGDQDMDDAAPLRRATLVIQASVAYEVLPALSLGVDVGLHKDLTQWLGVRVDVLAQHSQNDTIIGSAGIFDATLVAGSASLCAGGVVDDGIRFGLCGGLASGVVHAVGQGFSPNRSDTSLWLAVRSGVRLEVVWGVPWVLDVELVSPLVSPSFAVGPLDAPDHVAVPSSAALAIGFGPAISF